MGVEYVCRQFFPDCFLQMKGLKGRVWHEGPGDVRGIHTSFHPLNQGCALYGN